MSKYIQELTEIDLFTSKTIATMQENSSLMPNVAKYMRNSIVHLAGDKCHNLEIIVEGSALVQSIDQDGSVLTVKDLKAGEIMSANLLFSSSSYYPMSVFAKSDLVVVSFTKNQVLEFCNNKQFLESLLRLLADRTAVLSGVIRVLNQKSLREQIIDFLAAQYRLQNSFRIELAMTKKELASKFGVRRSSLSRELSKMRSDGLVKYDAKSITIVDEIVLDIKQE